MKFKYIKNLFNKKKGLGRLFWLARVLILIFVLIAISCFIYINEVGFPGYLQNMLIKNLESKGYRISVQRVKFGWYRGIIIENLKIETNNGDSTIILEANSADILPTMSSIFKRKPEIKRIGIFDGDLRILANKNQSSENLFICEIKHSFFRFYNDGTASFEVYGNVRKSKLNIYAQHVNLKSLFDSITKLFPEEKSKSGSDEFIAILNKINEIDFYDDSKIDIKINRITGSGDDLIAEVNFDFPFIYGKTFLARNLIGSISSIPIPFNLKRHKFYGDLNMNYFSSKGISLNNFTGNFSVQFNDNGTKEVLLNLKNKHLKTKNIELKDLSNTLRFSISGFNVNSLFSPIEIHGNTGEISYDGFRLTKLKYEGFITNNILTTNLIGINLKTSFGDGEMKDLNFEGVHLNYDGILNKRNGYQISGKIDFQSDTIRATNFQVKSINYSGIIDYSTTNVLPSIIKGDFKFSQFKNHNLEIHDCSTSISFEKSLSLTQNYITNLFDVLNSSILSLKTDFHNTIFHDVNINSIRANIESDLRNLRINELNVIFGNGDINLYGNFDKQKHYVNASIGSTTSLEILHAIVGNKFTFLTNYVNPKIPLSINVNVDGFVPELKRLFSSNAFEHLSKFNYKGELKLGAIRLGKENLNNVNCNFTYTTNSLTFNNFSFILKTNNFNTTGIINFRNYDYSLKINGFINPSDVFDIINITNIQISSLISNTSPFEITANIKANYRNIKDLELLLNSTNTLINARISATNFTFRNKAISELRCNVEYFNNILTFSNVELLRTNEKANADKIIADFNTQRVYLINAKGNLSPSDLTEAIGPEAYDALSPFKFHKTPTIKANGSVPMHGAIGDIEFDVFAPELEWWKIKVNNASSKIFWKDETVTLKNFYSDFYGGDLNLSLYADFLESGPTNLNFTAKITKAYFNDLLKDILKKPQKIEGKLSGVLEVSSKSITNYCEWHGKGEVTLEEGLIWDIPIFGIFSPILNTVSPGLGNSRANYASAHFILTNGIVATSDLEIRAKAVRMKYEGTVDFDKKIEAQVEAEVLRDVWLVGPAIRFLLKPLTKLFIYKVKGTIDKPVSEPLFIPKILLAPLHPFKTIKDYIFPSNEANDNEKEKK